MDGLSGVVSPIAESSLDGKADAEDHDSFAEVHGVYEDWVHRQKFKVVGGVATDAQDVDLADRNDENQQGEDVPLHHLLVSLCQLLGILQLDVVVVAAELKIDDDVG